MLGTTQQEPLRGRNGRGGKKESGRLQIQIKEGKNIGARKKWPQKKPRCDMWKAQEEVRK